MTPFDKFQRYLITLLIIVSSFYGGYYFGLRGFEFEIRKNPPELKVINKVPSDQDVDFGLFWEVWNTVRTQYLLRPVDGQAMLYGAIQGMVTSLGDPYTSFLPPQANESLDAALDGVYEGIGAELGLRDNKLIVVAPLDGSPAKEAGIKSGDWIVEIEGESTVGIGLTEAVYKIRGEANTTSSLTVVRDDSDPFAVTIKRGKITIESVSWRQEPTGVAYIRISRFGGDTNAIWDRVTSEINVQMNELNAIIIDLRGNPGGYLQSAVHVSGEFFRNKPVLFEEDSLGNTDSIDTTRIGSFEGLPVYVLVDGGSASASEILAAALKSNAKATLVGTKTFGKGTIQDVSDFGDGSGLNITVAKWLTPEKVWVHEKGIEPDVKIELNENYSEDNDAQLIKALELANSI